MSDFLDSFAGAGFENMGASERSAAWLQMLQPTSEFVDENNPAGTWRDSASGTNFGSTLRVVPLGFKVIWSERDSEPPNLTVARYEPDSIKVDIQRPPAGKRGFPKMINPETKNEIQETYMYALMCPDYPELGVLLFNPTVGNMKICRSWNTQMSGQRLSNGKIAPIFANKWMLTIGLIDNPKVKGMKIARLLDVCNEGRIEEELFAQHISPALQGVQNQLLLSAPAEEGAE